MPESSGRRAARLLAACAVFSVLVVLLALVLQHVFDMRPCAWCVLQRLQFLVAAAFSAAGAWLLRSRGARQACASLVGLVALSGLGAALHQQLVAAQSDSCALTLADRIVMTLSLHEIAPSIFLASASCAEANLPLLGMPFALWSALSFLLLIAGALLALRALRAGPRRKPG